MADDTERLLRDFLERERRAEEGGYTREAVLRAFDRVSSALQEHQRECARRWQDNDQRHRSAERRLQVLEADGADPAEITSTHRVGDLADRVKRATLESLRVPGADTEAYVRQVVTEEQEAVEKRAELKRLQQRERDDAAERDVLAKERRERNRLVVAGVAAAVGGAAILSLVQLVASHLH